MRSAIAVAPNNYIKYYKSGKIKGHQSEIIEFAKNGVKLKNGEFIECDLVITATGFKVDLSLLPPHFNNLISDDGLYLYKHMVRPGNSFSEISIEFSIFLIFTIFQ